MISKNKEKLHENTKKVWVNDFHRLEITENFESIIKIHSRFDVEALKKSEEGIPIFTIFFSKIEEEN